MTKQKTKRQLKQNPSRQNPPALRAPSLDKEGTIKKILEILRKRKWSVGVMESCTGGAVANCITNIPGASDVFGEGKVTYSVEAKIRSGVDKKIIEKYGVASKEVAEEMARKVDHAKSFAFRRTGIGIGVTGNLPGKVFVAVRVGEKVESIKFKVESKNKDKVEARKEMKEVVVERVINMIIDGI